MIGDLIQIFCVALLLAIAAMRRPTTARCFPNEYVEGVRRDGSTWCVHRPTKPEIDCSGTKRCVSDEPPRYSTPLMIYCTGGTRPIVVDYRTIGCQR